MLRKGWIFLSVAQSRTEFQLRNAAVSSCEITKMAVKLSQAAAGDCSIMVYLFIGDTFKKIDLEMIANILELKKTKQDKIKQRRNWGMAWLSLNVACRQVQTIVLLAHDLVHC